MVQPFRGLLYRVSDRWPAIRAQDMRGATFNFRPLLLLPLIVCWLCLGGAKAGAEPTVSTFSLTNGMQVVVIPDHRVPVVTHMVWYRAGAADPQ